jgi:hypothetical protein
MKILRKADCTIGQGGRDHRSFGGPNTGRHKRALSEYFLNDFPGMAEALVFVEGRIPQEVGPQQWLRAILFRLLSSIPRMKAG